MHFIYYVYNSIGELVPAMAASSPQAYLGVGLIGFYLVWMVGMATYRIVQNFKDDHHH
jgi:hypothetical protein